MKNWSEVWRSRFRSSRETFLRSPFSPPFFPPFFFVCAIPLLVFLVRVQGPRVEPRSSKGAREAKEEKKKEGKVEKTGYIPSLPVRPVFQLYYLRLWAGNYGSLTKRKEGREDYLFNPILHSHRQTSLLNSAKIRKCIKLLSFSFHGDKYGGIVRYFFPFLAFLFSWRKNGGGDSEIAQGWKALF